MKTKKLTLILTCLLTNSISDELFMGQPDKTATKKIRMT